MEQGLLTQGTLPYNKGSATSKEAAESMRPFAGNIREKVCGWIATSGSFGMTCDQIEFIYDRSHQTVSARIRELAKANRIKDSGRVRPTRSGRNAVVWVVS